MELFKIATKEAKGNGVLVDTIVKEILHYDIMEALYRSDVARDIVFQGGTALRLCYGGNRYSEDLDFVLREGSHFTPSLMIKFEDVFTDAV
ncbi:MAG: nucleotidyl transferase AbiEii/AbiGii toxin family protein [Sulfurospirillaceae bacterium]|nr:nucleotidyl transferase AbiEii/AbiGii toxin family protein [Sulfurospirillaceae bacterium]